MDGTVNFFRLSFSDKSVCIFFDFRQKGRWVGYLVLFEFTYGKILYMFLSNSDNMRLRFAVTWWCLLELLKI